jgi:hypothetical protein
MENTTAWITSCKINNSGWSVNGNLGVPNDPANRHCAAVLAWIAEGNTPAPEFTDAELAANAQQVINSEALAYLSSTDWLVIRELDGGTVMPADIKQLRAEAREQVI